MAVGGFLILLAAVIAGFLWPGGLLRHPAPAPPSLSPEDIPTTLPPDQTTVPGASDTTAAPGATVAPTTPSTGGP